MIYTINTQKSEVSEYPDQPELTIGTSTYIVSVRYKIHSLVTGECRTDGLIQEYPISQHGKESAINSFITWKYEGIRLTTEEALAKIARCNKPN